MRSMFSGSYSALDNQGGPDTVGHGDVYRATTRPSFDAGIPIARQTDNRFNLAESVKKLFRGAANNMSGNSGGRLRASQSVFVLPSIHENVNLPPMSSNTNASSAVNYDRLLRRDNRARRMPSSQSMEEAALLGCNPSESMDEVELRNIQLSFPPTRSLSRGEGLAVEERVETKFGTVLVAIQGDRSKPAIITYHDLGLNYVSNFQAFFNFVDMRILGQNFCIYHINAPGQEESAPTLPDSFVYPTMDQLAEQVMDVLLHFGLKRVIAFGVGAGANILCRFALSNSQTVDALCVLNCISTQAGWIEWGYQKINTRNLKSKGMTQGVLDYLMWHHFGRVTEERNHDLVYVYRNYFESNVNPQNLGMFIDSYIRRTDLAIERNLDPIRRKDARTLKMPVLNVTGAHSPHVDDTVTFNGRLDPVDSTWMKIQDCGMVLEEQPGKLAEAFRLFLQGQGYVPTLSSKKVSQNRKMSVDSGVSGAGSSAASSSVSLNNGTAKDGMSASSGVVTPKSVDPSSGTLINLASPDTAPATTKSGLEKGIIDIRITENPISESPELSSDLDANPTC
ncbi:Protein NDRG3 [Orchesella cincta]|uniref:Protein NDRG3 n=1 Tax=Orchesella cincta TaxID=48709 RepID=A0A1D2MFZ8_ORCCI|nr:Protein NDRG3 [Orchesella cincta]